MGRLPGGAKKRTPFSLAEKIEHNLEVNYFDTRQAIIRHIVEEDLATVTIPGLFTDEEFHAMQDVAFEGIRLHKQKWATNPLPSDSYMTYSPWCLVRFTHVYGTLVLISIEELYAW